MIASRAHGLLLGASILGGCAAANFAARPVDPKNPTRWTFDIAQDDAETLILAAFCLEEGQLWTAWKAPDDGEDILLYANLLDLVAPVYLSPVYHTARGPCPLHATFRLRLSAPSPGRTTIQVSAAGTRVVAGRTSGFLRVHGPADIVKPAEPTTVEEYVILRRCGAAFGVRDMPEANVPAEGVKAIASRLVEDRMEATATLLFLGGPEVTTPLASMLDRDEEGAAEAAYVLGRLKANASLPALERALESRRYDVRDAASSAIRAIRRPEPSVRDLVAKLSSRAALDRLDAAVALVGTGREVDEARPVLEPFLKSEIPSERWRAEAALVRLRRRSTTP